MQTATRRLASVIFGLAALLGGGSAMGAWTLQYASQPGAYVGNGNSETITDAQGTLYLESMAPDHVGFYYLDTTNLPSTVVFWNVDFSAPSGQTLSVGTYTAERWPFN